MAPTLAAGGALLWLRGTRSAAALVGCNFAEVLRVAYPLGALSYLNLAAKEGILVKDGRALETLGKIDTLLFDKTGTLTIARPHVAALHPAPGLDESTLLGYAASAEFHQTHPIAQAIQAAATARGTAVAAGGSRRRRLAATGAVHEHPARALRQLVGSPAGRTHDRDRDLRPDHTTGSMAGGAS